VGDLFVAAGIMVLGVAPADAATRALVVGVSGYPNLPEAIRLVGPKNDAREMANTLARLGVPSSDITVLADGATNLDAGITNAGPGTKSAILDGLDRLAATSKPGDLVVFYFSGHGSQQPDADGDEQGGADEIFLPYDVGRWSGAGVENALVDDELNERVEAILAKGADFFGVIDACHSATGFRALPGDDVRVRGVEPDELGVPAMSGAAERGLGEGETEPSAAARGRAAFFYAAQEDEEALEKTPAGATDGESYAVFTYQLISRLNQTQGLTYRTLHQAVVADIKRNTLMATQTPELEGNLLDEPVLGLTSAAARRQWPIYAGKLQAGTLQGVSKGALVALYDDPLAADDKALAYGIVDEAGATRSLASPAAPPCADGDCGAVADAAVFKKGRFARLARQGVDLGLVLSEPVRLDPADGHDYAGPIAALKSAVSSQSLSARVSVRSAGYDVAVGLIDGTLAFAPAGGAIDAQGPASSPRLTLPADPLQAQAKVEDAVGKMARATALQRLGGGSNGARALGLEPTIWVSRAKVKPGEGESCSEDDADYEPAVAKSDASVLGDCDILSIDMANKGKKPLDVTVFLIGADFAITPVWPVDGDANRILASESKRAAILQMEPHPESATEERLVFLAVPGVNRSHTAFTDLGQEGLRAVPGDEAPQTSDVRDLLASSLNDMSRSVVDKPVAVDEDMSIDIRSYLVGKETGG